MGMTDAGDVVHFWPVRELIESATSWLTANLGASGLVVIAFFDSSFLSLPEINDLLVATMALEEPTLFWLYALAATLGSALGCSALYVIGRRGGQPLLRKKLSEAQMAKLQAQVERFDVFTVLLPSLLPPPCPFKIFVLAAAVFGMSYGRFLVAVIVGRTMRYFAVSLLALRYGDAIIEWFDQHFLLVLATVVVAAVVVFVATRVTARLVGARKAS